jgi:hypothetical protein
MLEKYFKILGLKEGVDEKTLKKAYRNLALKHHPDVSKRPDADRKFKEICEAYEIILSRIRLETVVNVKGTFEEDLDIKYYEEVIREARRKAAERARMKYEKIKEEKEFFENNDFFTLFRYIGNYLALPLSIAMILVPVYLAITESFIVIFASMFFWIIGFFILSHIYTKRKTWFRPGKIHTTWKDIINFFKVEKRENATENCFYSSGKKANSSPFKYSLLKVRNISMSNKGTLSHQVNYTRKYKEIVIPRSSKAYLIHFLLSFIKPISFILLILILPVPSIIWRFILSGFFVIAGSNIIFFLSKTKSKTSFLFNPFLMIKIIIWLIVIISQTTYYPGFVVYTTPISYFLVFAMLFFLDSILDLIFRLFPFYKYLYLPIPKQPEILKTLFESGYQNYLDIPLWSNLYPFLRWLF